MSPRPGADRALLAVSDLHLGYAENRRFVDRLRPGTDQDWLIVAGDVGEMIGHVASGLRLLRDRFATVVWVPGNHELWTPPNDPVPLRGEARYHRLVEVCRELGVFTPEDPYPVWDGPGGPALVAPLFVLYDYTFRPPGARTREEALEAAYRTGVVCNDEFMLHPDPYPSRQAWCERRVAVTERRLAERSDLPTVLVNHFPLVREPTMVLRHPEFAQWCGTERTADWHLRFRAHCAVYGHLHIPRTTYHDGVRFEEVSLGYPREWRNRAYTPPPIPRRILPAPADD